MKKTNLNGQVLSEKEMKEVKGGYFRTGKDYEYWNVCSNCGHVYDPNEEFEQIIYDPATGLYGRLCLVCGSFIAEE